MLSSFSCLRTFCLPTTSWTDTDHVLEVSSLRNLTELDIGSVFLRMSTMNRFFVSHSPQPFGFGMPYGADTKAESLSNAISHLTGLVKLSTYLPIDGSLLDRFKRLTTLRMTVRGDNRVVLEHSLTNLELLEELELSSSVSISARAFSKLVRLKRLSLSTGEEIDEEFFRILPGLSQFTSLTVHHPYGTSPPLSYFAQFNLLSNLRELCIASGSDLLSNLCDVFQEGSFPRLRALRIGLGDFSNDTRRRMMERFPCLNALETFYTR